MRFAIVFGCFMLANAVRLIPAENAWIIALALAWSLLMDLAEYGQRNRKS